MMRLRQFLSFLQPSRGQIQTFGWLIFAIASALNAQPANAVSAQPANAVSALPANGDLAANQVKKKIATDSVVEDRNAGSEKPENPKSPTTSQTPDQESDRPSQDQDKDLPKISEKAKPSKPNNKTNFHRPNDPRPRRAAPPKKASKPKAIRMKTWRKSCKTEEKNTRATPLTTKNRSTTQDSKQKVADAPKQPPGKVVEDSKEPTLSS